MGPRGTIARALSTADVDVRSLGNGSFRFTLDVEIDPETLAFIGTVAERHKRSVGLQVWKYLADLLRAWRAPKPMWHNPADRIAARYGE